MNEKEPPICRAASSAAGDTHARTSMPTSSTPPSSSKRISGKLTHSLLRAQRAGRLQISRGTGGGFVSTAAWYILANATRSVTAECSHSDQC